MLQTVTVTGSFYRHGQPYPGLVRCIPDELWTLDGLKAWANLAPTAWTGPDGVFTIQLTATTSWRYLIVCPAGSFRVHVPYDSNGHTLRELISANHAGQGPAF